VPGETAPRTVPLTWALSLSQATPGLAAPGCGPGAPMSAVLSKSGCDTSLAPPHRACSRAALGTFLSGCGALSSWRRPTYALREARYRALRPLPAPMPHASATTALKTLGFPATPFHDPVHDPSLVAWLCRGPPHRARCGIPLLHRPSALGDGLHSS
jgi:hypothetical protein